MPARLRPRRLAAATLALVAGGAALPAPGSAATVADRSGYALTEAAWDGTASRTITVDARDAHRELTFLATVRDPTGALADAGLPVGFARSATRLGSFWLAAPATPVGVGRTSFTLSAARGSQELRVAVPRTPPVTEAFAPDGDAAASVTASLVVRATTTAASTTRRVVRGARISVRGRLDGRAGDPTGTTVRVQLRRAGAWRTIATAPVGEDVRWRTAVRLPRDVRGRAELRAVVLPSATCPYARGPATPLAVAVR